MAWLLLVALFVLPLLLLYSVHSSRRRAFSLDGRVVLITGAGHGLGRCLARTLAARANLAALVLLDVDTHALEQLKGDPRVLVAVCDVSDDEAVAACVARVCEQLGRRVDVLVNNAGVVSGRSLLALPPARVRRTFAVNALAHFWTVRAVLPGMLVDPTRDALIVTVSSMMALAGSAGLTDYCASKAALQRDRVAHVRTLLVCPSAVDTGMFAGAFAGGGWRLRFARWLVPFLDEQEVADRIVAAMASDRQQLLVCARGWRGWLLPWGPALVRLLPVALMDALVGLAGGHHGMSSFVGRADTVATTR
ncbi:hypothetical protein PybrP1_005214 [[Pythium] brassicae (nom. inval.)]|nr:hypothetical protein PybrP1_005214 [[Pythium] brassicae (nom. inval.)]